MSTSSWQLPAILAFALSACATPPENEAALTRFELSAPAALSSEGQRYREDIAAAFVLVDAFFDARGLGPVRPDLVEKVILFETVDAARADVAARFGAPLDAVPETFSGLFASGTLYLVAEPAYEKTFRALYPDWPYAEGEYRRLIAHELAHGAHEDVALDRFGTADAMGPGWFFEGLAVMAAGQFEASSPLLGRAALQDLVGDGRTPQASYPVYGKIVRSMAALYGVERLVVAAGGEDFPDALLETEGK